MFSSRISRQTIRVVNSVRHMSGSAEQAKKEAMQAGSKEAMQAGGKEAMQVESKEAMQVGSKEAMQVGSEEAMQVVVLDEHRCERGDVMDDGNDVSNCSNSILVEELRCLGLQNEKIPKRHLTFRVSARCLIV